MVMLSVNKVSDGGIYQFIFSCTDRNRITKKEIMKAQPWHRERLEMDGVSFGQENSLLNCPWSLV